MEVTEDVPEETLHFNQKPSPSQKEIARISKEIRKDWTKADFRKRAGLSEEVFTVPTIRDGSSGAHRRGKLI